MTKIPNKPKAEIEKWRNLQREHPTHIEIPGPGRVTPQPGEYYSGWITSDIVGPFKGEPGTEY